MKNNVLALGMLFSTIILSSAANAGLINSRIEHKGILAVPGKDSIVLSQHAGKSISLNKGYMEIVTEKVPLGFSLLDPRLVLKQNGKSLVIDVPLNNYHNEETFTLAAKDSGLNYDLYLRKTETKGKAVEKVETQICTYQEVGYNCGVDVNGAYNCVMGLKDKTGTEEARNSYVDTVTTYKLTLGRNNVLQAEFTSSNTKSSKVSSESLSNCR